MDENGWKYNVGKPSANGFDNASPNNPSSHWNSVPPKIEKDYLINSITFNEF